MGATGLYGVGRFPVVNFLLPRSQLLLPTYGRGARVDLGLGVVCGLAVGVGLGVEVGVAVGVEEGVAVAVAIGVAVAVGVAPGVIVGVAVDVGVAVAVEVGVGVGVPPPGKFGSCNTVPSKPEIQTFREAVAKILLREY